MRQRARSWPRWTWWCMRRACREAVDGADAVVLAVKPQMLKQACAELLPHLQGELIVSIAAGTRRASIARWSVPTPPRHASCAPCQTRRR